MAYIQDENTIQMDWLYSNVVGGVHVQISEEDFEAAKDILQESPIADTPVDFPVCPKCFSHKTALDELPRRLSFLTLLLVGFPFLFSKTRWKCSECGHTWNLRKKSEQDATTFL